MSFFSIKHEIRRSHLSILVCLCIALLGLNIFLLAQNQKLKQLAKNTRESSVTVGTKLLPLRGFDATGNKIEISSDTGKKTLVLVYSATCRFCKKNVPNWMAILRSMPTENIRVVGVALGRDGEDFLRKYELANKFSTINLLPESLAEAPPFDVTPQTILLDSNGMVEKVWSGVFDGKNLDGVLDAVIKSNSVSEIK